MADRLDVALPMGCWVKVSVKAKVKGREPTFMKLDGCVGARPAVSEGWIFDHTNGSLAAELTKEPTVTRCPGMLIIVLYPGGIKLRLNPSIDAGVVGNVARAFEVQVADGIVTTHDNMESYALLQGGAWLPCRGPTGAEVARRTTERTEVREGRLRVRYYCTSGSILCTMNIRSYFETPSHPIV